MELCNTNLSDFYLISFFDSSQSLSPAGSASSGGDRDRDALNVSESETELPKSIIVTNVDLLVFDDDETKVTDVTDLFKVTVVTRFAEILPLWQYFKALGKLLRVHQVFVTISILIWQKFDAIGQVYIVVDGQLF